MKVDLETRISSLEKEILRLDIIEDGIFKHELEINSLWSVIKRNKLLVVPGVIIALTGWSYNVAVFIHLITHWN